jgi:hypothetical protein
MRALIVIAASIAGLAAGVAGVRAADLRVQTHDYERCCYVGYGPAAPLVIYDDEPGVAIRRWWLPPWRNRHFFPHGGGKLKVSDRRESGQPQRRRVPRYARYWTNPPVYVFDSSPLLMRDVDPLPRPRPRRYPPPTVADP